MADEPNVTPPSIEPPLTNSAEVRTPTGELKDQGQPPSTSSTSQSEQKTDGDQPKSTEGAPETYAAFKTAAEGRELDKSTLDKATSIFKELGLNQANAQKLVDLFQDITKGEVDKSIKLVNDMREGWRSEIAKDPEMGGKLEKIKVEIGQMKDMIFANDPKAKAAFNEAMDITGAGDHPAIVRGWWKAAQAWLEGTHVSGAAPSVQGQRPPNSSERPSLAAAMYPTLPH